MKALQNVIRSRFVRRLGIPVLNGGEDLLVLVAGVFHHVGTLSVHPDSKHASQNVGLGGGSHERVIAGRFDDSQVKVVVRLIELVGDLLAFFRRIGLLLTLHQLPHGVVFFRDQLNVFRRRSLGGTSGGEGFDQVANLVKLLNFWFVDRSHDRTDLRNEFDHSFGRELTGSFANGCGRDADFFADGTIQQSGAGLEFARDQFLTQMVIGTARVRFDLVTPWSHCREVGVGRDEMDPGPTRCNAIGPVSLPVTQLRSYASIDAAVQTHSDEVYAVVAEQKRSRHAGLVAHRPWVAA